MLFIPRSWEFEPWREVAASIESADSLTLVATGLVEAERTHWLRNIENRAYLSVPFQVYKVSGQVLPLSRVPDETYLSEVIYPAVEQALLQHRKVTLIAAGHGRAASNVIDSYADKLMTQGFSSIRSQTNGLLVVAEFTRARSPAQP